MKFIVVTDICQNPVPSDCVTAHLSGVTDITRLHLNELCQRPDLKGESLHNHLFNQGGIEIAIAALHRHGHTNAVGLGYSAGGTALWRGVQMGLELRALFCVSSTRLREYTRVTIPTHVYFGGADPHIPSQNWMINTPARHTVFQGAAHNFYNSDNIKYRNIIASDVTDFQIRCGTA